MRLKTIYNFLLNLIFIFLLSCNVKSGIKQNNNKVESVNTEIKEKDTLKRTISHNALVKPNSKFNIYKSNLTEFNLAQKFYQSYFVSDTNLVTKKNDIFKLKIRNGEYQIFQDVNYNSDSMQMEEARYYYLGQFPAISQYLVNGVFYEYSEYYLINKQNGEKNTIMGRPKISPNKNILANINEMGGFADELFGFQISFLKNKKNQLIEIYNDFKWYPMDFVWDKDNTLIIKIIDCNSKDFQNGKYEKSKDIEYLKIEFK
ncbi:MAG: hypothetical protein HYR91_09885 [Flavobacteriia bacterium]|nr:hypothetical protein [Flavobacteriia bacterium]